MVGIVLILLSTVIVVGLKKIQHLHSITRSLVHSFTFDVLNNDETIRMHPTSNTSSQLHIKNARSSIKKQLKKDYIRNWLKAATTLPKALERNLQTKKSNSTTNWKTISKLSETQHIE